MASSEDDVNTENSQNIVFFYVGNNYITAAYPMLWAYIQFKVFGGSDAIGFRSKWGNSPWTEWKSI